ncbi:hypothetical protein AB0I91_43835 [Actinosynnema sp. NPDC049800]
MTASSNVDRALPADGSVVALRELPAATAEYRTGADPQRRVTDVRLEVTVPAGLAEHRKTALPAVRQHCTVHNTLRRAPEIIAELDEVES